MFTKNGTVKKTALEEYSNPRGKGIIAITLEKGDELDRCEKDRRQKRSYYRDEERSFDQIQ